jgi:hypothetical protein
MLLNMGNDAEAYLLVKAIQAVSQKAASISALSWTHVEQLRNAG